MDQDKTDLAQRPQTLLEAAKETIAYLDMGLASRTWTSSLRAAIAREEAIPSSSHQALVWKARANRAEDRAQQAESTAAWHKARVGAAECGAGEGPRRKRALCACCRTSACGGSAPRRPRPELARLGQQLARLCELQANPPVIVTQPFEGNPQTCAFGSNAVGGKIGPYSWRDNPALQPVIEDPDPVDPTTGFTFATYRRLLEALGGKS